MAASSRLKLYLDLVSQPSRAVLLFCRVNNIEVEQHLVNLQEKEQRTPEFQAINPLGKVPFTVDGRFKLAERALHLELKMLCKKDLDSLCKGAEAASQEYHAIMGYLASTRPDVADHWYPADVHWRAKIDISSALASSKPATWFSDSGVQQGISIHGRGQRRSMGRS